MEKAEKKQLKREAKAQRRQYRRKTKAVLTRQQIAEQLRILATQIENGTFVLGDIELDIPQNAELEVGYKLAKKGGHQIGVEVEWGSLTDVPLLMA
jgi:amphi-Trp domain-containing protein